ncbi:MAG: right-handed parallel beta-helix repeat-containing protein [Candidatus Bathyarchaeota archaeon]|jgi:parallel beta-helix repeat protein
MKINLKSLVTLVILVFSTFVLINGMLFRIVKGTYVEGIINQDTIWTLVDSPFVLSEDVIVQSNATLTIEPGVEVRFGGDFSLNVSGKLLADGTSDRITFTSNRENPEPGDWNAIVFNGVEKSIIKGCFLAHAKNGIVIENGWVDIMNNNITLCSQNGITVVNGIVTVYNCRVTYCSQIGISAEKSQTTIRDSTILENGGAGVVLVGSAQTIIRDNTILSNKNGIHILGTEISTISISQNVIAANQQNGIQLDVVNFTDISVTHNNVSSNHVGFFVSSQTSTYITNNSISFNDIGVTYSYGNHTASFNDIYSNEMGMDVTLSANVNAEHNFWGNESGPYHQSMNPLGTGNPVGGDGINLDFIFFSTEPYGYINTRPIPTLITDMTLVQPSTPITFYATPSFDEGRVDRYLFEFGDGESSGWTTLSIFTHKYSLGVYNASVTVMDDCGVTSVKSPEITISVQDLPMFYVNIDLSSETVDEGDDVSVTVYVNDGNQSIDAAYLELYAIGSNGSSFVTGYTNSTGHFTTVFTSPFVTEITVLRIVATASKNGFTDASDYEYLLVSPSFTVQVLAERSLISSAETILVWVYVESNGQPVPEALVSMEWNDGFYSHPQGLTDSMGVFTTNFTAPRTSVPVSIDITASAQKTGYVTTNGQVTVEVQAEGMTTPFLSLTTILLILIPVIIAIVVFLLFKFKVISFSVEEEN